MLYESVLSYNRLALLVVVLFQLTTILPQEALNLLGSPEVCFVDVREISEYEAGHIPGSLLLPWNSGVFEQEWSTIPTDRTIIVYCRSGNRSGKASQFLYEKQLTNIMNMLGGFSTYSQLPEAKIERGSYSAIPDWSLY